MNDEEFHQVIDGAATAVEMLVDGVLQSTIVIGVYADGSGFKLWSTGNERVNDHLRVQLLNALPLPPRRPLAEEDDGA